MRHARRHVRVEDEDGALLGLAEVLEHAIDIKFLGNRIVISEISLLKTGVSDNVVME